MYLVSKRNHVFIYRKQKDLDESKCESQENLVNDVMSTIRTMVNPFEIDEDVLVNLASGVVVDGKIADDLLKAENIGEEQFSAFVKTNVTCSELDIFATISRNKIKTFSSTTKNTTVKNSRG